METVSSIRAREKMAVDARHNLLLENQFPVRNFKASNSWQMGHNSPEFFFFFQLFFFVQELSWSLLPKYI